MNRRIVPGIGAIGDADTNLEGTIYLTDVLGTIVKMDKNLGVKQTFDLRHKLGIQSPTAVKVDNTLYNPAQIPGISNRVTSQPADTTLHLPGEPGFYVMGRTEADSTEYSFVHGAKTSQRSFAFSFTLLQLRQTDLAVSGAVTFGAEYRDTQSEKVDHCSTEFAAGSCRSVGAPFQLIVGAQGHSLHSLDLTTLHFAGCDDAKRNWAYGRQDITPEALALPIYATRLTATSSSEAQGLAKYVQLSQAFVYYGRAYQKVAVCKGGAIEFVADTDAASTHCQGYSSSQTSVSESAFRTRPSVAAVWDRFSARLAPTPAPPPTQHSSSTSLVGTILGEQSSAAEFTVVSAAGSGGGGGTIADFDDRRVYHYTDTFAAGDTATAEPTIHTFQWISTSSDTTLHQTDGAIAVGNIVRIRLDLKRNTIDIAHGRMSANGGLVGLSSGMDRAGGSYAQDPVDFGPTFMDTCFSSTSSPHMASPPTESTQAQSELKTQQERKRQEGLVGNLNIYALATDETSVYTADTGSPAVLLKIDKRTMTIAKSLKLNTGEDDVRTLVADEWHPKEQHLFACTNTIPARIIKIHKATMQRAGAVTLSVGQVSGLCS
jgi:hypothetical protein